MGVRDGSALASLRAQIARIEGRSRRGRSVLPFGIREVDARLPGGGLARGALHEVAGGGNGAIDGAAAALFAGGVAARTRGKVLWCITRADLFAPALAQAGLAPDRVIHLEAGDDKTVLACMEEGLRHGGLGAVVAEIADRTMVMTGGEAVEMGDVGTLFAAPQHPYTRALLSAVPSPDPVKERSRARVKLHGDLPSPLDPKASLRFMKSKLTDHAPFYRPALVEVSPGHWVAEHDPAGGVAGLAVA